MILDVPIVEGRELDPHCPCDLEGANHFPLRTFDLLLCDFREQDRDVTFLDALDLLVTPFG